MQNRLREEGRGGRGGGGNEEVHETWWGFGGGGGGQGALASPLDAVGQSQMQPAPHLGPCHLHCLPILPAVSSLCSMYCQLTMAATQSSTSLLSTITALICADAK